MVFIRNNICSDSVSDTAMVLRWILVFLFIVRCLPIHLDKDVMTFVNDTLPQLCPFNDFCQTVAVKDLNELTLDVPCCSSCSCDDECLKLGNCCFDKEVKGQGQYTRAGSSVSRFTCTGSLITLDNEMRAHNDERYGMKYLVSGVCPGKNGTSDVIRQCHDSRITSFEDLIWVTDTSSRQIYKNKYCAECDGKTQYSYWNLKTNCKYIYDALSLLYNDKCLFKMEPPLNNETAISQYECEIPEITQCNETGKWSFYSRTLYLACTSLTLPYRSYKIVYKNRYCYMCNQGDVDLGPPGKDECKANYDRTPGVSTSYITLLDFQKVAKRKHQTHDEGHVQCKFDQIYDQYLVS